MRISFWPTLCNPRGIPSDVLETNRKLGRCIAETAGYANEERRGMICDIHLSLSFLRLFWLPTLISNETLLIREKRKEPTTLVEAHTPRVADTDSNVCSLITLNQVADRWRCYFELNVVSLLDWNSHTGATVPTNSERMKGREAEREREKERERERKRERGRLTRFSTSLRVSKDYTRNKIHQNKGFVEQLSHRDSAIVRSGTSMYDSRQHSLHSLLISFLSVRTDHHRYPLVSSAHEKRLSKGISLAEHWKLISTSTNVPHGLLEKNSIGVFRAQNASVVVASW